MLATLWAVAPKVLSRLHFPFVPHKIRGESSADHRSHAMADIRIVLISNDDKPSPDADWAAQFAPRLQAEIDARKPAIRPVVQVAAGFSKLPSIEELGPLSVVALVLPDTKRGFLQPEAEKIAAFQQSRSRGDIRLIPLARESGRNVPGPPLNGIVSQKIPDPIQTVDLQRLATFLLNLIGLRLGGAERKLFISYTTRDGAQGVGLQAAAHLATVLKDRGYQVWRDQLTDRDGQPFIGPGTEAQETIEKAILDHGFALVIDSPAAPQSTWVHAEIDTAYAHMLPMLPVVIEDTVNTAGEGNIPIGGRFHVLQQMQRQQRAFRSSTSPEKPSSRSWTLPGWMAWKKR